MGLQGWQWIAVIALALLLFGAPKLPKMTRSLGQSMRIFKSEVNQMKNDTGSDGTDGSESSQRHGETNSSIEAVESPVVDGADRGSVQNDTQNRPRLQAHPTIRPETNSS